MPTVSDSTQNRRDVERMSKKSFAINSRRVREKVRELRTAKSGAAICIKMQRKVKITAVRSQVSHPVY